MNYSETFLFYIFASIAIASAAAAVSNPRPAYGALAFAASILALSGLFVLLHAYFVAVIQTLIYAGAILVLFLFVMMLIGIGKPEPAENRALWKVFTLPEKISSVANIFLLAAFLASLALVIASIKSPLFAQKDFAGTAEAVGEALFNRYLLPFELVSAILLIGIVGVVHLTQKELKKEILPLRGSESR